MMVSTNPDFIQQLSGSLENEIQKLLHPDETVYVKIAGERNQALVCTQSRVIIVKVGFWTGSVFGSDSFQLPYGQIAGVQVKYFVFSGYFEISAGGMINSDKKIHGGTDKQDAATAPNCIVLYGAKTTQLFRQACSFINERIVEQSAPAMLVSAAQPHGAAEPPDVIDLIQRLGKLRDSGHITAEEFETKKRELLARV